MRMAEHSTRLFNTAILPHQIFIGSMGGQRVRSLLLSICLLSLVGCDDIETPNGKIPAQYISKAQKLVGAFQGQFKRKPTTVILSLEGHSPIVEIHNNAANDLLGAPCQSQIGKLIKISLDENDVGSAVFEFSGNKCFVQGETITLHFKDNSLTAIDLLDSYTWENNCYPNAGFIYRSNHAPVMPPSAPDPNCRWESRPNYLLGKFERVM